MKKKIKELGSVWLSGRSFFYDDSTARFERQKASKQRRKNRLQNETDLKQIAVHAAPGARSLPFTRACFVEARSRGAVPGSGCPDMCIFEQCFHSPAKSKGPPHIHPTALAPTEALGGVLGACPRSPLYPGSFFIPVSHFCSCHYEHEYRPYLWANAGWHKTKCAGCGTGRHFTNGAGRQCA